jgi:MFS family permease
MGRVGRVCLNPVLEAECQSAPGLTETHLRLAPALGPRYSRADLRKIVGEGAAHSIMVGVGESYLPAFVLAMGMGQVAAGLITTIPLLAGAVLQLVSPAAVHYLGSHRRWVVTCAALQASSFVPMAIAAWYGQLPVLVMFALAAVYWGSGLGTATAWSTWVEKLVPARLRTNYFSRRTRFNQIATLGGFLLGGFSLQWGAAHGQALTVFAVLFLLAALARLTSTLFLASQSEPEPIPNGHRHVSMLEFFRRFRHSGDGRLLVYLLSVQAAAQIAGPYFTPFMLRSLKMSYVSYVTLIAISFAAKAIALPAIGMLARRYGTRTLLWLGGVGIVPISGLWLISNSFPFLCVVQLLAGITWAAYELAMFLLFFETIRPAERTGMLTNFNFAHSLATAAGSLLGGALLWQLGKHAETYLLLFALSSVARALSLVMLWRVPAAPRAELLPAATANVVVRPVPSRAA